MDKTRIIEKLVEGGSRKLWCEYQPVGEVARTKVTNIMPMEDWAFKVVCDNLKGNLPDFDFKDMQLQHGGVKHLVSPNMFKFVKGDKQTVLRLDGHRWYENFMSDNDKQEKGT